jgi:hypothetical protein
MTTRALNSGILKSLSRFIRVSMPISSANKINENRFQDYPYGQGDAQLMDLHEVGWKAKADICEGLQRSRCDFLAGVGAA